MKREYKPKGWQLDPEMIDTEKVQYWHNGIMLTANITRENAQRMITKNEAFVISSQAIGSMLNGIATS